MCPELLHAVPTWRAVTLHIALLALISATMSDCDWYLSSRLASLAAAVQRAALQLPDTHSEVGFLCIPGIDGGNSAAANSIINWLLGLPISTGIAPELEDIFICVRTNTGNARAAPALHVYAPAKAQSSASLDTLLMLAQAVYTPPEHCLDDGDALEEFKLRSFAAACADVHAVLVPSPGIGQDSNERAPVARAGADSTWEQHAPLIRAYGLAGLSTGGFFTQVHAVYDARSVLAAVLANVDAAYTLALHTGAGARAAGVLNSARAPLTRRALRGSAAQALCAGAALCSQAAQFAELAARPLRDAWASAGLPALGPLQWPSQAVQTAGCLPLASAGVWAWGTDGSCQQLDETGERGASAGAPCAVTVHTTCENHAVVAARTVHLLNSSAQAGATVAVASTARSIHAALCQAVARALLCVDFSGSELQAKLRSALACALPSMAQLVDSCSAAQAGACVCLRGVAAHGGSVLWQARLAASVGEEPRVQSLAVSQSLCAMALPGAGQLLHVATAGTGADVAPTLLLDTVVLARTGMAAALEAALEHAPQRALAGAVVSNVTSCAPCWDAWTDDLPDDAAGWPESGDDSGTGSSSTLGAAWGGVQGVLAVQLEPGSVVHFPVVRAASHEDGILLQLAGGGRTRLSAQAMRQLSHSALDVAATWGEPVVSATQWRAALGPLWPSPSSVDEQLQRVVQAQRMDNMDRRNPSSPAQYMQAEHASVSSLACCFDAVEAAEHVDAAMTACARVVNTTPGLTMATAQQVAAVSALGSLRSSLPGMAGCTAAATSVALYLAGGSPAAGRLAELASSWTNSASQAAGARAALGFAAGAARAGAGQASLRDALLAVRDEAAPWAAHEVATCLDQATAAGGTPRLSSPPSTLHGAAWAARAAVLSAAQCHLNAACLHMPASVPLPAARLAHAAALHSSTRVLLVTSDSPVHGHAVAEAVATLTRSGRTWQVVDSAGLLAPTCWSASTAPQQDCVARELLPASLGPALADAVVAAGLARRAAAPDAPPQCLAVVLPPGMSCAAFVAYMKRAGATAAATVQIQASGLRASVCQVQSATDEVDVLMQAHVHVRVCQPGVPPARGVSSQQLALLHGMHCVPGLTTALVSLHAPAAPSVPLPVAGRAWLASQNVALMELPCAAQDSWPNLHGVLSLLQAQAMCGPLLQSTAGEGAALGPLCATATLATAPVTAWQMHALGDKVLAASMCGVPAPDHGVASTDGAHGQVADCGAPQLLAVHCAAPVQRSAASAWLAAHTVQLPEDAPVAALFGSAMFSEVAGALALHEGEKGRSDLTSPALYAFGLLSVQPEGIGSAAWYAVFAAGGQVRWWPWTEPASALGACALLASTAGLGTLMLVRPQATAGRPSALASALACWRPALSTGQPEVHGSRLPAEASQVLTARAAGKPAVDWWYDGSRWVSFDGRFSAVHPDMPSIRDAFAAFANERIASENVAAAEQAASASVAVHAAARAVELALQRDAATCQAAGVVTSTAPASARKHTGLLDAPGPSCVLPAPAAPAWWTQQPKRIDLEALAKSWDMPA